jgi:hypothetical protein
MGARCWWGEGEGGARGEGASGGSSEAGAGSEADAGREAGAGYTGKGPGEAGLAAVAAAEAEATAAAAAAAERAAWAAAEAAAEREREFLPAALRPTGAAAHAARADWATVDLRARLDALQLEPRGCVRAAAAPFPNHGAAATVHYLAVQLKRGLRDARPVVFHGPWIYAGCPSADLACVLRPLSACSLHNASRPAGGAAGAEAEAVVGYSRREEEVEPAWLPPLYAAEGKSLLWSALFPSFTRRPRRPCVGPAPALRRPCARPHCEGRLAPAGSRRS